ncbi:MAG: hypothetical protein ACM33B_02295 [Pseudomonadota bacterium]
MSTRTVPLLASLLVALALVPAVSARPATTEPASLRLVKVTLTNTSARFATTRLERGTIAQFEMRNTSKAPLRLVIAGARGPVVKPGKSAQLLVHVSVRGRLTWSLLSGSKRLARGSLLVV